MKLGVDWRMGCGRWHLSQRGARLDCGNVPDQILEMCVVVESHVRLWKVVLKCVAVSCRRPRVFKCIDDGVVQSHKEEVSYGRLRVFQVFFIMCKMSKKFP